MPELPEVEAYRKYIEAGLFDAEIESIELLREKVLKTDLGTFREATVGRHFDKTRRIGKYLFLGLEDGNWVLMHFGMTGKPEFYQDVELQPRHSRLIFHFKNGLKLAYVCMRMFGRVELVKSIETYQEENKLGVDALEVSQKGFIDYIKGRKAAIKTVLLQQQGFAGVGNWIADEVLFQARIHPQVKANDLGTKQLQLIFEKLQEVLKISVEVDADYQQFPDHFMVKERWGDGHCPVCGDELLRIVVGGRGTYLCKREQGKG